MAQEKDLSSHVSAHCSGAVLRLRKQRSCGTDSSCLGTHEYGATVLDPSVGKSMKSDTTLTSELTVGAVWKISLRERSSSGISWRFDVKGEISRYRSLVGGPYDIAGADLVADERRTIGVCEVVRTNARSKMYAQTIMQALQ